MLSSSFTKLRHLSVLDFRLRRKLEDDYYAYKDEVRQHPWYTHTMILILIVLLILSTGYGLYQFMSALGNSDRLLSLTKCATDEVVDDRTEPRGGAGSPTHELIRIQDSKPTKQTGYVCMNDDNQDAGVMV